MLKIHGGRVILAGIVALQGVLGASAAHADAPSLHAAYGADDIGGTFALGRRDIAYEAMYEQPDVVRNIGLAFSYLNEGHITEHVLFYEPVTMPLHIRDSYALQLLAWSPWLGRCRAAAAAGPETYFDTTTGAYRTLYENRHGFGLRATIAGQCRVTPTLAVEITANRSFDIASYDATTAMLGVVFTPQGPESSDAGGNGRPAGRSAYLELVAGETAVDSLRVHQEEGYAVWATYEHSLGASLAADFSLLTEDVSTFAGSLQRRSLAGQIVAVHDFGARWLSLFAGVGPALARTNIGVNGPCNGIGPVCNEMTPQIYTKINVLYSYGLRCAVGERMSLVLKFGRVASFSSRADSDLVTAGFGVNLL